MRGLIEKDVGILRDTAEQLCRTLGPSAKISVLFPSNRPSPWALTVYVAKQQVVCYEGGEKLDPICIHRTESFCEDVVDKMYERAICEIRALRLICP